MVHSLKLQLLCRLAASSGSSLSDRNDAHHFFNALLSSSCSAASFICASAFVWAFRCSSSSCWSAFLGSLGYEIYGFASAHHPHLKVTVLSTGKKSTPASLCWLTATGPVLTTKVSPPCPADFRCSLRRNSGSRCRECNQRSTIGHCHASIAPLGNDNVSKKIDRFNVKRGSRPFASNQSCLTARGTSNTGCVVPWKKGEGSSKLDLLPVAATSRNGDCER